MKKLLKTPGAVVVLFVLFVGVACGSYFFIRSYNESKREYHSGMMDMTPVPYEIQKKDCNEYSIYKPEKYDIAKKYHKTYLELLKNDIEAAWELVPSKVKKNQYQDDINNYKKFVKKYVNKNAYGNELVKYNERNYRSMKMYSTVDENGLRIIVHEYGVWKYEAYLAGQVNISDRNIK